MNIKIVLFIFLTYSLLFAQNNAYINKEGTLVHIGNDYIERIINLEPGNFGTVKFINKLSGKSYNVKSDVFGLKIVFSGVGPAYGTGQNGENNVLLTAKDFDFRGYKISDLPGNGKKLELGFKFEWEFTDFNLTVNYEVYPGRFSLRKWIEVSDSSSGLQFLDKIFIESLYFVNGKYSRGQFGQPVFNNDVFFGVEYPTAENTFVDHGFRMGYVVGKKITKEKYVSHKAVTGTAVSNIKLRQAFMDYVDSIKVNGTKPYLLYNSWYDFRNPSIVKDSASVMNVENVLNRISTFKKFMYDKYKIALNAFVLDDGWDKYTSMWEIDSSRFPQGFTPLVKALAPMKTGLGIWASPFCGYSNRNLRVDWAAKHGYEKVGDFLCFAGTKYKSAYKNRMVEYTKKYNLGYFKWDGFLLACNEPEHGHLTGIYSREANVSTYIDIINAVRKVNPGIYLNITTGTWLSPWWLKYADCIWMQGADYAYAEDVPSINPRDKSITYRDAVLWEDYKKLNLLFPMSSLMTHGIIKGRLNFLGGKNESLASFSNEVMMYFGRGVMMWELYVSPDLLTDAEWNAIASSVKWAKANKDVLSKTQMILGNPLKREPYGYIHLRKEKGILLLRNPDVMKQKVEFSLSGELGDIDTNAEYFVKVVYPFNYIYPVPVKANSVINLELDGYQVLTAELIPADKINGQLPLGIRYDVADGNLILYGEEGTEKDLYSVSGNHTGTIKFGQVKKSIAFEEQAGTEFDGKHFKTKFTVNVPGNYRNVKIGFLLEPVNKLKDDNKPHFEIKVDGKRKPLTIEQENGKWFWVLTELHNNENIIQCSANFKNEEKYKSSFFILADEILVSKKVERKGLPLEEVLPSKPYNGNINKRIILIGNHNIKN